MRVVIIGGDSADAAVLRGLLAERGVETESLGALPEGPPTPADLVLLDQSLLVVGGRGLLEKTRARYPRACACLLARFARGPLDLDLLTSGLWDALYVPPQAEEVDDLLARAGELAARRDQPGPAKRVLVVDDDEAVREASVSLVRQQGYLADAAVDALEALGLLQLQSYDLVVTDVQMPGIDGVALLGRIRAAQPLLPVVISTGHATVDTAVAALRRGATDFLRKPFSAEDFVQVIERALRFGELARENVELEARARAEKLRLRERQYELRVLASAILEMSRAVRPAQVAECWLRAAGRMVEVPCGAVLLAHPQRELVLTATRDEAGLAGRVLAEVSRRAPRLLGEQSEEAPPVARVAGIAGDSGAFCLRDGIAELRLLGPEADPCAAVVTLHPAGSARTAREESFLRSLSAAAGQVLEKLRAFAGEARLREAAMVAGMHQGVILAEPQGRVLVINEAARALIGCPPGVHPESLAALAAGWGLPMADAVAELLRSGADTRAMECVVRLPAERILDLDLSAIRGEGGETIAVVGLLRDITDRRETERMKTEFVTIVSHELRTPLTSIKNCHSLLLGGGTGDLTPAQERFLRMAQTSLERIIRLVNDLLDVARIESGGIPLQCAPVDLAVLLREVGNEIEYLVLERRLRLVLSGIDAPLVVWADHERLKQVFYNLLHNAVKFSPPEGTIELRALARSPGVDPKMQSGTALLEVQVIDEGTGIAPRDRERIFERFQQVAGTLGAEQQGGVGLGLPISRGIVRSHGGEILAEGRPGGGSIFRVLLPPGLPAAAAGSTGCPGAGSGV